MAQKLFVGISLCTALAIYVVTRPTPNPARAQLTQSQLAELQPQPPKANPPAQTAKVEPPEEEPDDGGLAPEVFEDGAGS